MKRSVIMVIVLALVAGACRSETAESSTTVTTPTTTTTTSVAPSTTTSIPPATTTATTTTTQPEFVSVGLQPRALDPFANFTAIPLLDETRVYPGPPTPGTLDDVAMSEWMADWLEPAGAAEVLAKNGFVILPDRTSRLFHQPYEGIPYDNGVAYVTTDVAYHSWHLVFSKVLRETEQDVLLPILEDLITGLVVASRAQNLELSGTAVA